MDAASALADLAEISSQVEAAVVLDAEGRVLASTLDDAARGERFARVALDLLAAGNGVRRAAGRSVTQLEAALREGSVFVASDDRRRIVATTTPGAASGLVFYDLRACLRSLAEDEQKPEPDPSPRRRRRTKQQAADA